MMAVAGAMSAVKCHIDNSNELSYSGDLRVTANQCRAASEMASGSATVMCGVRDQKKVVIHHAELMLKLVKELPEEHELEGVQSCLDFARQAAQFLEQALEVLKLYGVKS